MGPAAVSSSSSSALANSQRAKNALTGAAMIRAADSGRNRLGVEMRAAPQTPIAKVPWFARRSLSLAHPSLTATSDFLVEYLMHAIEAELRGPRNTPLRRGFHDLPWHPSLRREKLRFDEVDLRRLHAALDLPAELESPRSSGYGLRFRSDEGLLIILLSRLAWPSRQRGEISHEFRRQQPEISEIFNTMIWEIDKRWKSKLEMWHEGLTPACLQTYADAIDELHGISAKFPEFAQLVSVVGWIDGSCFPIARPSGHEDQQRAFYNGRERAHVVKIQAIVHPCGIAHVYGPVAGTRHDAGIYADSGVDRALAAHFGPAVDGRPSPVIYGDVAYADTDVLVRPYKVCYRCHLVDSSFRANRVIQYSTLLYEVVRSLYCHSRVLNPNLSLWTRAPWFSLTQLCPWERRFNPIRKSSTSS